MPLKFVILAAHEIPAVSEADLMAARPQVYPLFEMLQLEHVSAKRFALYHLERALVGETPPVWTLLEECDYKEGIVRGLLTVASSTMESGDGRAVRRTVQRALNVAVMLSYIPAYLYYLECDDTTMLLNEISEHFWEEPIVIRVLLLGFQLVKLAPLGVLTSNWMRKYVSLSNTYSEECWQAVAMICTQCGTLLDHAPRLQADDRRYRLYQLASMLPVPRKRTRAVVSVVSAIACAVAACDLPLRACPISQAQWDEYNELLVAAAGPATDVALALSVVLAFPDIRVDSMDMLRAVAMWVTAPLTTAQIRATRDVVGVYLGDARETVRDKYGTIDMSGLPQLVARPGRRPWVECLRDDENSTRFLCDIVVPLFGSVTVDSDAFYALDVCMLVVECLAQLDRLALLRGRNLAEVFMRQLLDCQANRSWLRLHWTLKAVVQVQMDGGINGELMRADFYEFLGRMARETPMTADIEAARDQLMQGAREAELDEKLSVLRVD